MILVLLEIFDMSQELNTRIALTPKEIKLAFKFFSGDGKRITRDDIKQKLERYFPDLSVKDYKFLVNGGQREAAAANAEPMTEQALLRLLNVKDEMAEMTTSKRDAYDGRGLLNMSFEPAFEVCAYISSTKIYSCLVCSCWSRHPRVN